MRDRGVLAGQEDGSSCEKLSEDVNIENVLFVSDSHKGLDVQFSDVKTQFETIIASESGDPLQEMSPELCEKMHVEICIPVPIVNKTAPPSSVDIELL
jgi:hypothetical protein